MGTAIRRACRNDAMHVAALMDIAGHGIEAEFWAANREIDNSSLAVARQRIIEDHSLPYHFSKVHLLEIDGEVAGGLIGGLVEAEAEAASGFPAYFAPLLELEGYAKGHWAVIGVAVYPEFRGQGLARALLRHAEDLAIAEAAQGLSLVVEDSNAGAIALYASLGFREAERRAWLAYGGRQGPAYWLLLTRPL